ncbi:hypothetical protein Y032_0638g968 [Ancylostoma ceylanicum]|uniref:BPTI/Kunitz inhibitor domain-containing protein n=1 Tax=Ancylostoma ceylanicum TaxID=53326 RepID=A0A016WJR1_9BILA|nr:hypothetical protein Y032_0638g968 [Ancylostoma ceylanicum]
MRLLLAILFILMGFVATRRLYYCHTPFVPHDKENCTPKKKMFTYDWTIDKEDKCIPVECCDCSGTYNIWSNKDDCNKLCIS